MVSLLSPLDTLPQIITARLQGTVDSLTPLPWHSSRQSYSAVWHQSDGPTPVVIRVYDGNRGLEAMRCESNALRDLSRAGFPVPMLFLAVEDPSAIGSPFMVMEHLEGNPLGSFVLNDAARIPYWLDQACNLLRRLHSLPWQDSFDWLQPPLDDFAERQVRWWSRQAQSIHADDAKPGFEWLMTNIYRTKRVKRRALVHRDFHPNNLLANANRITGVVDWGELTIADPAVDVAWSRMVLSTEVNGALGDAFLDAYVRRDPEIGVSLAFWEVFAACKRLTSMVALINANNHLPSLNETVRDSVRQFMHQRLSQED